MILTKLKKMKIIITTRKMKIVHLIITKILKVDGKKEMAAQILW